MRGPTELQYLFFTTDQTLGRIDPLRPLVSVLQNPDGSD